MINKYRQYILYVIIVSCLMPVIVLGQSDKGSLLKTYLHNIDEIRERLPIEKLYLQLDKPYYTLGDTIHFKAYLLNADYLTPSTRSGILYAELDNANNQAVKRIAVPIASGISWSDIALDEKEIPEGSYTLRAYTNWMQNFGEDFVFKKNIYISALSGSTLVKADFKLDTMSEKSKVQAMLYFASLDKDPLRLKDMQLRVINGTHTQTKYKGSTGLDGSMALNFDLTDKTAIKNLTIQAQQTGKGADTATLAIPVIFNRPEKTDLQFMPEGGNLVAGIQTKVGFKALSEDGKGVTISGKIINSKQQEVASFKSDHKGMGSFEFIPETGGSYTAKILLLNGVIKNYLLPAVHVTGTTLKVNPKADDSLELTINASTNLLGADNTGIYYIIAQSRGVVCYAAAFDFSEGLINEHLPKSLFPTGITRFTLLNSTNQPLNERLVYINHNDNLQISIQPDRSKYNTRDSIALAIQVKDKTGKPMRGTFSLAVADGAQVRADSIGGNMVNNLLFTADLKGDIEEPNYYFNNINSQKELELDKLLLTQGWVGYDWKSVFDVKKNTPAFKAEKEFAVEGKLTNIFNKPVKKERVMLMRKHPFMITDTVTDNEGHFVFKGDDYLPSDSAFFLVEVKNKSGKNAHVNVNVDDFTPPEFAPPALRELPWYVNSDTLLLNNSHMKAAQVKAESQYNGGGKMLKDVVIKDKKVIPGSRNPHPDDDDVVFDEKDMNAAKKMTLLEFLSQKFQVQEKRGYYLMKGHFIVILNIDGMGGGTSKFFMDYLTAEDIKGIEIVYILTAKRGYDFAILHITTYADTKNLSHEPGTYVYKPITFTRPTQFYRPRYTAKNSTIAIGTDLRSTIHWEPNIITDKDGKALVSFYSADKPADYNVVVEGTDLKGDIGTERAKIKIVSKQDMP